ncbi:MAG TPA: GGDEF domain-containing protein, partial [Aquabacterium sp.]|nr:GGDEF domain-containing protein [Aquabacterium sp.]
KRNNLELWIALIDLDFFKRINDTWGHGVGDEVLKGFANHAVRTLRSADVVGRWGGEEFLFIMLENPGADPNFGVERLRASLADQAISPSVPDLRIGFSAGLARCLPQETVDATIDRADRALYGAKNAGRNRSVKA